MGMGGRDRKINAADMRTLRHLTGYTRLDIKINTGICG
jgi:hypothetical protein